MYGIFPEDYYRPKQLPFLLRLIAKNLPNHIQLLICQIAIAVDPNTIDHAINGQLKTPSKIIQRTIAVDQRVDGRLTPRRGHCMGQLALLHSS